MPLHDDLKLIENTVRRLDPSFRAIAPDVLDQHLEVLGRVTEEDDEDAFLLCAMRLLALPNNGHTRLIPNEAISVLPLRFVSIGNAVRLQDAAPAFGEAIGGELLGINGVPIGDFERASLGLLAGTPQRKRVIGPILLVWPSALRQLGVPFQGNGITYRIRRETGQIITLRLNQDDLVPGATFYPRSEHGRPNALWSPDTYAQFEEFDGAGLLISLPSFFDEEGHALAAAISDAANRVRSRPSTPLIIDVRGNTGGNFLLTLPLMDAISAGAGRRSVAVLVDKFTFSAAIVFVAILTHRLGGRLMIIGEEMGDGLTFYAEGASLALPSSGAIMRYSSAFHDWAAATHDETTPAEIAAHLVAAGQLELDRIWTANVDDVDKRDELCREIFAGLTD